jgi:hypothetical protein
VILVAVHEWSEIVPVCPDLERADARLKLAKPKFARGKGRQCWLPMQSVGASTIHSADETSTRAARTV